MLSFTNDFEEKMEGIPNFQFIFREKSFKYEPNLKSSFELLKEFLTCKRSNVFYSDEFKHDNHTILFYCIFSFKQVYFEIGPSKPLGVFNKDLE